MGKAPPGLILPRTWREVLPGGTGMSPVPACPPAPGAGYPRSDRRRCRRRRQTDLTPPSRERHAGTAEPQRVAPPEAEVLCHNKITNCYKYPVSHFFPIQMLYQPSSIIPNQGDIMWLSPPATGVHCRHLCSVSPDGDLRIHKLP